MINIVWCRETCGRRIAVFMSYVLITVVCAGGLIYNAYAQSAGQRLPAPPGAAVYFHYPLNGVTVPSRFKVRIGLRGMGVAPAGIAKAGTGHHHLLVDAPPPALDRPLPNDPQHLHLGNGQTELEVTLPPGKHVLQLVLADHEHVPHNPPILSQRITITVRDTEAARAQ
jgi:hypothetical protein